MTTLSSIRTKLDQLKGARDKTERDYRQARSSHVTASRNLAATQEAQAFIQLVAEETQSQLRYHITELGSIALEAVFGDGRKLDLEFVPKAGKTQAIISFLKNGRPTDPLGEDSGGAVNIATLGLRPTMMCIRKPKLRSFICLDEPIKDLNDPTREMHRRAAEMIKQISRKGMQFLIVSQIPELEEIADKVFSID